MRDFGWLAGELLARGESLVRDWLNGGRQVGHEIVAGGLDGRPGRSLSVNVLTGQWADFDPDGGGKGGDLVSLYAAINNMSQAEAYDRLVEDLGLSPGSAAPAAPRNAAKSKRPADERRVLMPVPLDAPPWSAPKRMLEKGMKLEGHWFYKNVEGRLLMVVARWRDADGEKTYQPYCYVQNGDRCYWSAKALPKPWPLYRLDLLAARPSARVLIVEGEKDADAAQAALGDGWVVTCSPSGSANARHADWSHVYRFESVQCWPDFDQPGIEYGHAVGTLVPQCRVIDPELLAEMMAKSGWSMPAKGGAADVPAEAWATIRELLELGTMPELAVPEIAAEQTPAAQEPDIEDVMRNAAADTPYAGLVRKWVRFIDERELRPDAMHGWRDRATGITQETGDGELQQRWMHSLLLDGSKVVLQEVQTCCTVTISDWRMARRKRLVGKLIGRPSTDKGRDELAAMVAAWISAPTPLDVAVVQHWLWQVKRRAAGLPVEHDLMPVLVGAQGGGKTTALAMLSEVWEELSVPLTAQQITDQREAPTLAKALVGIWDEMSGASKADSEALKRAISATQMAWRQLYSHAYETRRRTVTFFGSSNIPVCNVVRDTSGARRFYELRTHRLNWDALNKIDHALVWDSVSEHDPAPILDHLVALRQHQRSLVAGDLVSAWMEHEISRGMDKLVITRPDCPDAEVIAAYEGTTRADGSKDPGGWTTGQIASRIAFYGRPFGSGRVAIDILPTRLRQLGWDLVQKRVGSRAKNQREWRWYIDPAVRAEMLAEAVPEDACQELRHELAKAIADENFERAAVLRDQIKEHAKAIGQDTTQQVEDAGDVNQSTNNDGQEVREDEYDGPF